MMFETIDCRTMTDDVAVTRPRAGMAPPVLDLAHLRVYTLGMADLEREILGLFLEQLPKSHAALLASETAKDWHMAAHTLKGSALAVGAKRLAGAGAAAEATDCTNDRARRAMLDQVVEAIADVRAEILRQDLI
ncbi:MAG: Hpt domain-containing protein [Hyphomicrobiaceae bacterium]